MRLVSWNVNGLRACLRSGRFEEFLRLDADVYALQEIKMEPHQAELPLEGYFKYWNPAMKKGYSGTAVFSVTEPLNNTLGMNIEEHDTEGRVITLEFKDFYFVNVYTPNSRQELVRLPYRTRWDDAFREYVCSLDAVKPVVICGDLNCAHREIDLKNPKSNRRNAGFTDEERSKLSELLEKGFVDIFREKNPELTGAYTWWSYMGKARERNAGWRIDYFLCSRRFFDGVKDVIIHSDIMGSDHCPVELILF